jgi:hypothetical protein
MSPAVSAQRESMSARLDTSELDDLGPLLGFITEEFAELLG